LSRETASRGSPSRSRRTSSIFRWALQRSGNSSGPLGPEGSPPASSPLVGFFPIPTSVGHRHPTIWDGPVQRNRMRSTGFQVSTGDKEPDSYSDSLASSSYHYEGPFCCTSR